MDAIVVIILLIVVSILVLPFVALVKASNAKREASEVADQLQNLIGRVDLLEKKLREARLEAVLPLPVPERPLTKPPTVAVDQPPPLQSVPDPSVNDWMNERLPKATIPPPLQQRVKIADYVEAAKPAPPPLTPAEPKEPKEPFSLEQFMGVKLFAWLGAVAMFFGVIFFVKYAFENNLIPPAVRVGLGFLTGIGFLIGGLVSHKLERYRVLAQVFLATGVLILYGVTFAAHAIYHFPFFGTWMTFGLMAAITVIAFLLAVRLDALVVAILGMLGGFLTPALLSTGQDSVIGLFGYIALLDIGLLAVSRHRKWQFLSSAAAIGTILIHVGWFVKFFQVGHYSEGYKILIPMGILGFFIVLFLAATWLERSKTSLHAAKSMIGLTTVAMVFATLLLEFEQVALKYAVLYGFVLGVNIAVIVLVAIQPQLKYAQLVVAVGTFLHLASWTNTYLSEDNLMGALVIFLIFGALHAIVPVILSRRMPAHIGIVPLKAGPWFGPFVLLLMLMPVLSLSSVPLILWVGILIADLMVIALAAATGAVIPLLASLLLTMLIAAVWLLQVPVQSQSLSPFLLVITGFSVVFSIAGKALFRGKETEVPGHTHALDSAQVVSVASATLPFALLVLALGRLPVANPASVFGVALLMTSLLTGLAVVGKRGSLFLVALFGTLAVEGVWHSKHFQSASPTTALSWYLGFYALFFAVPFVFRKASSSGSALWITSALSGVGHFLLIHDLIKQSYPNTIMGLLPLAFATPTLIGLGVILKKFPVMDSQQQSRIAWFGGVGLLFVTLVFPIQFQNQWLTVSWAIEGALLLWLFRRVPHVGLQFTGLALLMVSFIRLTFNLAVFSDYPRSGTPVLNWYLYVYGLVAAAQFAGGYWFTDPTARWKRYQTQGILYAFGGVLLFFLLNIEIADYFSTPGDRCVAFRFGGNFARDMTYSIAWGTFSLGLLGIGFWRGLRFVRYSAVILLVATLVKLFLHDLASTQSIFRIGALIGVAMIAFIASFLYQRFFDRSKLP